METTMTLTGYIGHPLELKQTKTGVSTVSFRVGSTPRIRTDSGWIDGTTTWVTVECYRVLADHVVKSVGKGDAVIVHGKIRTQSWLDAQGTARERMVLEAVSVGHDLNRGVAAFVKAYRGPEVRMPEEPSPDEPPAVMPARESDESGDGEDFAAVELDT